jgi:opacity protein-like surface antigen
MKARFVILLSLLICMVAWQNASAQTDMGFKGAGLRLGFVAPESIDSTPSFGVFMDLGTVSPRVGLEAYGSYWSQTEDLFGFGEASVKDIAIGGRSKYYIPVTNPQFQPYVGGGLGLHFVTARVATPAEDFGGFLIPATEAEETYTKLGLDLGGGVAAPLGISTKLLGEVWYSVVSDVSQFSMNVGVQYNFGS